MAAGNPYYDIHALIWTRLETKPNFANNVAAGNRIKWTASTEEILGVKAQAAQGKPEVVVVDVGTTFGDRVASNATLIIRQWEIWLRGCDRDIDKYFDISFAITQAMLGWDTAETGLKGKTWSTYGGECRNCRLLSSEESILRGPEYAKQTNGWAAKFVGQTHLWFAHATMVAG